ncbi:MAG TPA: Spy/CpxP family protein refolding chaperone [Trinickia sp.]
MKRTMMILACSLAASLGVGAGNAFAQTPASGAKTQAQTSAAPVESASAPADARAAKHEARVDQRIAYLHAQLKITPAQEPQWKAFADVMRANGQNMGRLYRQRTQAEQTQSALDNMKQYAELAQAHADDMKQLVDAFEPLYNSMSPEQKKVADTTFRERPHERGRRTGAKPGATSKP